MASQMYACQTAAFEAARSYGGAPRKSRSNPDEPPERPLDLVAACKHKKEVVSNLPKNCSHCKAPIQPEWVQEINMTIYAYCKSKEGCGKSQVLFVGPQEYISRTYARACNFEDKEAEAEAEAEEELSQLPPMMETMAAPPSMMETMDPFPFLTETMEPPPSMMETMAAPPMMETMAAPPMMETMAAPPSTEPLEDLSRLHITETSVAVCARARGRSARPRPYVGTELCAKCDKPHSEHRGNTDEDGWYVVKTESATEPADWPVYQSPGVWKSRN